MQKTCVLLGLTAIDKNKLLLENVNFFGRDMRRLYSKATIKQLQEWTDNMPLTRQSSRINWKRFLGHVVNETGTKLTDQSPVVITDLDFVQKVIKLIDATSPRVLGIFTLIFTFIYRIKN